MVTPPKAFSCDPAAVAAELQRLAEHPALADRAQGLMHLAEALKSDKDLSPWTDVDIVSVLGSNGDSEDFGEDRGRLRYLDLLRTALIFLPILATWLGLVVAGSAYEKLVASDPSSRDEAFLKLWFDGFHGHTAFGLDRIAGFIGLVLALIIAISVIRDVDLARVRGSARQAHLCLRPTLLQAAYILNDRKPSAPELMRKTIAAAADELRHVVEQAETVTAGLRSSFAHIEAVAGRLEAGVELSVTAAGTISASVDRVNGSVGELRNQVRASVQDSTVAGERSIGRLTESVVDVARKMTGAVEAVEAGLTQSLAELAVQNSRAVARSADSVTQALSTIEGGVTSALSVSADSTEAMSRVVSEAAAAVETMDKRIQVLLAEVEEQIEASGELVVTAHDDARKHMETVLHDVAGRLHDNSQKLAEHVERSSAWIVGAANELIGQSTRAMSSAEVTYDRIGRAVSDVSARLDVMVDHRNSSGELLVAHTEAARKLSTLDGTLGHVDRSLGGVVDAWSTIAGHLERVDVDRERDRVELAAWYDGMMGELRSMVEALRSPIAELTTFRQGAGRPVNLIKQHVPSPDRVAA
ncbi:hypothetical protein [Virgisporangium aliadipatigenens]|uniref:hypothetical protein n=1 Tax=Virgisporangium aliadipatigenens TaxID=741659 RepID=UPI001941BDA2|nr:hypothetical protein [Virgisporangium aliadipatigenens]